MGLFGIIACIIAAVKGHKTFAWVTGIWTCIAFFIALSGAVQYAIAPGAVFLIIAISMKKVDNSEQEIKQVETVDSMQNTPRELKYICKACGEYSTGWYQTCPKCGVTGRMEKAAEPIVIDVERNKSVDNIADIDSVDIVDSFKNINESEQEPVEDKPSSEQILEEIYKSPVQNIMKCSGLYAIDGGTAKPCNVEIVNKKALRINNSSSSRHATGLMLGAVGRAIYEAAHEDEYNKGLFIVLLDDIVRVEKSSHPRMKEGWRICTRDDRQLDVTLKGQVLTYLKDKLDDRWNKEQLVDSN